MAVDSRQFCIQQYRLSARAAIHDIDHHSQSVLDASPQIRLFGKSTLAICARAADHNRGYLLIDCFFNGATSSGRRMG
jgi:hypothetical protein